ncbi:MULTISPECIES: hypothetical protein [unclassified Coleofasciculus]|uniref:hypothetical protein n=1 Tax=unclassified Coleofasciculus TaxID=2692782 RepID=UPI0018809338|nr:MULTISPECIES: hypothetical protein [unclassified Coleofasciculus]MBE9124730.1 hypothetical protein [Coleofasciculus sp. LEGE 07081]MBE9148182.1 hypothetical protein [Coleofasciculus sp. LEGE 07092]
MPSIKEQVREQVNKPILPKARNILAVCFLALTGLTAISIVLDLYAAAKVNAVAKRRTTFAQLVDGKTIYISEEKANFRYPQTIKNFVEKWTQLALNWEQKIPGTNQTDPGFRVERGKVPLSTYFATLLMEPEFGKASLPKLAELVPPGIFSGQARQTVIISYLSEPREMAPGTWEVDMVATRVLVDLEIGKDERIPFNRTFRLKATPIQEPTFGEDSNSFEKKAYELRSAGLEIVRMSEYIPE